jgi:predicted NAD/FAD-binding protein
MARPLNLFVAFNMEKESKREQKRNSAKKTREHQVYTKKHIRLQEKNKSSQGQDKAKGT